MRLTILGKSPAWSDAGGACSSYLIEEGETTVVLDCGNGAFGKLRARVDYRDVDAALVSHLHGDHLLDLVPFAYALTLGPGSGKRTGKPRLIAPLGAGAFFRRLAGTWGDEELLLDAFTLEEYEPSSETAVGEIAIRTHPVPHIGPTHAIELIAPSGARIVFGADGRYSDRLTELAGGADVLIAEATLVEPDPAPLEERGHMSAREAGELAARAGVRRLVLTHISDELDPTHALAEARAGFAGPVEIAAEGAAYSTG